MADISARFWSKVDVRDPEDCWKWQAYRTPDGYGQFQAAGDAHHAHRVAWTLENGPIPGGLCVLHSCDNRSCVNPGHLFLGTRADNMADASRKGRIARGEQHYRAKLTEADVIEIRVRYRAGGITQTELGREFGVAQGAINRIVHDGTWKHLLEE